MKVFSCDVRTSKKQNKTKQNLFFFKNEKKAKKQKKLQTSKN